MASDIAEFLWSKFLKSLAELELESKSGFITISFFNSSIKDLMSDFKAIKDYVNERDIMPEGYSDSNTIDLFYDLNDALVECRVIVLECKEIKNKLLSLNPRRLISLTTIKNKLTDIQDKLKKLPSSPEEVDSPKSPPSSQEIKIQKLPSSVFGFDEQSKKIVELLLGDSSSSSSGVRLTKIGVIGIAGVGKTTLVQKVLDEVKNKFGRVLWIPFSGIKEGEQQYSKFTFKTCILDGLGKTLETTVGLDSLVKSLQQRLSDESYLIVLDDVCYQHINIMERLVSRLPKAGGGALAALIITSRLKEVAEKLGEHHHFVPLEPLGSEDCSCIIEEMIEKEKKLSLGGELEKMKNRCHGLPLAAKTLAQIYTETLK